MNTSALTAREIEAMTFVFTAPAPATSGGRGPWTRLLRWAREKVRRHRGRESIAMEAVDWSFPGL
jgi:hypothetical protein